ncbi:putative quinol monooxygenase [Agaribacterium haliotis]|uniref:putative quinol monooxygenase n=1 Tax=Agaribacterium haliotis TaxID=2013869 RepID=UPI000BB53052|nr:putative quinol monooxygenase [Agaribacterium haliotis]
MVSKLVVFKVKEIERLEELEKQLIIFKKSTDAEADCFNFIFYRNENNPGSYVLYETFSDQAALEAHLTLPHAKVFFELDLIETSEVISLQELV